MDEKTAELRDIFTSVTDEETVTEAQQDTRGSLAGRDEGHVDERLFEVIGAMRDRYEFETDMEDESLLSVVKGCYEGQPDEEIAETLDVDAEAVFEARMDLHLFEDRDLEDVELATVRNSDDDAGLAAEFGIEAADVARTRRVAEAQDASRRANDRYRDEFDSILDERELAERMTGDIQKDGLEDATEGMETDVSF